MDKELPEIVVPNEVLIQIFSLLKVADVRSCRLVCRRWFSCCEDRKITRAEKFIFRSAIDRPSKINEFLGNLERAHRVTVELHKIDLTELNFESFGEKVEKLELRNCIVDADTLTNLFHTTPNMTRLLISYPDVFSYNKSDLKIWSEVVDRLRKQKFTNPNLKEFKWNILRDEQITDSLARTFSNFFSIFPCIQSISLWNQVWLYKIREFMNILPETNITHVGGTIEIIFDRINQIQTFAPFSRLKMLNLHSMFHGHEALTLILWEEFFSQMTELEDLSFTLCTSIRILPPANLMPANEDYANVAKAVLFQILRNCLKLRKLSFLLNENIGIRLQPDEVLEFSSLITKFEKLRLPRLEYELNLKKNGDGLLTDLDCKVKSCHAFKAVGNRIMEMNQLTNLSLSIDIGFFSTNFGKILQSQECLKRLNISITGERGCIYNSILDDAERSIHKRLNHFEFRIHPSESNSPIDYLIRSLCMWIFPNLLTFKVSSNTHQYETKFQILRPQLKNLFDEWLGNMTTLIEIDVGLRIQSPPLNFEHCVHVCKKLFRLQKIHWTDWEIRTPREELIKLFVHLPNLRSLSRGYQSQRSVYRYYRPENLLFYCKKFGLTNSFEYNLI